jgi:hypothetical protein
MEQNYFEYNAVIYQQTEGLALGLGCPHLPNTLRDIHTTHGTHTDTEHFGKT